MSPRPLLAHPQHHGDADQPEPAERQRPHSLAQQRKLRPLFVERKPRAERYGWMREALGRKVNETVGAHLLQIWLVGAHAKLLCDFLDGLGIAHDANGTIEALPPAPTKEALAKAIDPLFAQHDPGVVAVSSVST